MTIFRLKFYGYTWEEYAFQISNLKGIFIIYKGNLDCEGAIFLKEILYVGYHRGIYEMYDEGLMNQMKKFVGSNERIFLSYSEVPIGAEEKVIESILRNSIKPRLIRDIETIPSEIAIICEGACALFPEELLSKES